MEVIKVMNGVVVGTGKIQVETRETIGRGINHGVWRKRLAKLHGGGDLLKLWNHSTWSSEEDLTIHLNHTSFPSCSRTDDEDDDDGDDEEKEDDDEDDDGDDSFPDK